MTTLKGGSQVFDLTPGEVLTIAAVGDGSVAYLSVESAIGTPPTLSSSSIAGGSSGSVGPFTVQCAIKVYAIGRVTVARGDGSPVSGAGNQIMTAGASGSVTDWQASATGKEGWLFQPSGLTGTASFSLDASNDGVTVAETLWSVALYVSDNNRNCFPFPQGIGIGYAKYRWRCTNDGGGTHNIARGF